jgi:hypothetical protein
MTEHAHSDDITQQRITLLSRISTYAARAAGVLLLVGLCSMLSLVAGLPDASNHEGAAAVSVGLQFVGLMVVCGAVVMLGGALFVTMVLSSADHPAVVWLGGILQIAIGLWLLLFVLRTPLNGGNLGGWLIMAACALSFLVAGGSLLAVRILQRRVDAGPT